MLVRHLYTSWQNIAIGIYSNAFSASVFTDHITSIKRVLCAFQTVYYLSGYGASLFYPVGHASRRLPAIMSPGYLFWMFSTASSLRPVEASY